MSIAQISIAQMSIAQISVAQMSIAQISIAQMSIAPLVATRDWVKIIIRTEQQQLWWLDLTLFDLFEAFISPIENLIIPLALNWVQLETVVEAVWIQSKQNPTYIWLSVGRVIQKSVLKFIIF
jgi:hypothetical protein